MKYISHFLLGLALFQNQAIQAKTHYKDKRQAPSISKQKNKQSRSKAAYALLAAIPTLGVGTYVFMPNNHSQQTTGNGTTASKPTSPTDHTTGTDDGTPIQKPISNNEHIKVETPAASPTTGNDPTTSKPTSPRDHT
ncbi:MAG: hypothetical protein AAF380_01645, partial [Bacteroidota bacterium]